MRRIYTEGERGRERGGIKTAVDNFDAVKCLGFFIRHKKKCKKPPTRKGEEIKTGVYIIRCVMFFVFSIKKCKKRARERR